MFFGRKRISFTLVSLCILLAQNTRSVKITDQDETQSLDCDNDGDDCCGGNNVDIDIDFKVNVAKEEAVEEATEEAAEAGDSQGTATSEVTLMPNDE